MLYLLKKNKIISLHNIEFRKIEGATKLLAYESSQALPTLIATMLKESDNTIANSLFKAIGFLYYHDKGSWQNGNNAVHDILVKSINLDIPRTTLIDGAGGSRYNYVTPNK